MNMRAHMHIDTERLARGPATEEWARIDPIVYVTAARRLQAQAAAEAVRAGWDALRRGLSALGGVLRRHLLEPIARHSERQRALAELATMDERLLADIGLRRSDIALAVDGRLSGPRMARRAQVGAAALRGPALQGELGRAPAAAANSNQPERVPGLAA
jgi:uncharacterized protein YjiS (DUF1127 family)